jgi:hypothetical protein
MFTRTTPFLIMAWAFLTPTGPLNAQEVNSDVKIPPPRELVAGTPAISGLFIGTDALFTSEGEQFGDAVARASQGRLSEGETRDELGDFMTSLLVRAGIVAFDRPGAALGSSGGKAEDGSWSAWTGPTPSVLSVSRRGRSASVRRR